MWIILVKVFLLVVESKILECAISFSSSSEKKLFILLSMFTSQGVGKIGKRFGLSVNSFNLFDKYRYAYTL